MSLLATSMTNLSIKMIAGVKLLQKRFVVIYAAIGRSSFELISVVTNHVARVSMPQSANASFELIGVVTDHTTRVSMPQSADTSFEITYPVVIKPVSMPQLACTTLLLHDTMPNNSVSMPQLANVSFEPFPMTFQRRGNLVSMPQSARLTFPIPRVVW
jgi:hypothetical protein